MTMANLGGVFAWPRAALPTGEVNFANVEVWSTVPRIAFICQAPKAGTLDAVGLWCAAVFSNQTIRVSFQNLTGSDPDGTQDQYRNITIAGTGTWNETGLITSDGTDTGSKRTVTKGEWFAIVVEYPGATGDIMFSYLRDNNVGAAGYTAAMGADGFLKTYTGGAWSATGVQMTGMCIALKYNDGTYAQFRGFHVPATAFATEAFNTGSSPDERGLYFTTTAKLRVAGAWVMLDLDNACDIVLYDTDGTTALATTSLASTPRGSTATAPHFIHFSSDVDLPVGSGYRLVVKPTTGSSVGLYVITVNASAHRDAHPGGSACQYTGRADAGAWTQTATKVPQLGLIVTGVDDGVSTGGGASFGGGA